MDYTNFVKTYYRIALSKINNFSHYKGSFNNLNYGLDIDPQYLHTVVPKIDILPNFELVVNAPIKEYEKFFDYYSKLYPELGIVFPVKENMNNLYNFAVNQGIIDNEEKNIEYINLTIDILLDVLKAKGILE